jgi:hypothetical protein
MRTPARSIRQAHLNRGEFADRARPTDLPRWIRAVDQAMCAGHEFSLIHDQALCSHHDATAVFVRFRALWLIPLDLKVRVTAHCLIAEPLDGA